MKKALMLIFAAIFSLSLVSALSSCKKDDSTSESSESNSSPSFETEYISEQLFSALTGKARYSGDYVYDHVVDEYDKKFHIETVYGGDYISQTESDKDTGEVYYDYVYGKQIRRLTVISRTIDNKISVNVSEALFEDYYNPFDLLTAKDLARVSENQYSVYNKDKAKKAASAITGWTENISEFVITFAGDKPTNAHIVTDKIYRLQGSEEYYVSTYDLTISDHGTAAVDSVKLSPYPHDASHDVLKAALDKAAVQTNYTVRHQGHEPGYVEPDGGETRPGYGDTDYKVYVTEDMVYDSYAGEEHGFKLLNNYVYPFTYDSKTKEVVLTDPVGQNIKAYQAEFSGFNVELFKHIGDGVFIPQNNAVSSIIAPLFAEGNESTQYSYAVDFKIILKNNELYQVVFEYQTYGITEIVTLTYDFGSTPDFSFLDFENAKKTSVLEGYYGEYKDENGHFCKVDKSGFYLDGEEIAVTDYGKTTDGVEYFTGKWKNTIVTIMKFSSKQLLIQSDDYSINYTLTSVENDDIVIPDKFKGTWSITNAEESLNYKIIVQSRAVFVNGKSTPVVSYKEAEGITVKYNDDTLYILDVNEDEEGKFITVLLMHSDSTYIKFSLTQTSADCGIEIPSEYVGTYLSDDRKYTAIITVSAITINGTQFIPDSYSDANGFTGTYGAVTDYYVQFWKINGKTDKDKIVVGSSSGNRILKRVASPKENYLGTWESDPEIEAYHYTVIFTETELIINGVNYEINFDAQYGYKVNWNDPSRPYTAYILFYYNLYGNPSMMLYDDNDLMINLFKKDASKIPQYFIGVWKGKDATRNLDAEVVIDKNGNIKIKIGNGAYETVAAKLANNKFTFVKDGKNWIIDYSESQHTLNLFQASTIDATLKKTISYTVPEALYGSWSDTAKGVSVTIDKDGISFTLSGKTTAIIDAEITSSGSGGNAVYYVTFTLGELTYSAEYGTYGDAFVIYVYNADDEYVTNYYLEKAN